MLRRTGWGLLLVCLLAGFPAASSSSPTSPRWLSYGHDGQLTNFVRLPGLSSKTAKRLRLRWRKTLDGPIIASPLYANGTLYAETEAGSIYALRPSDGATRWHRTLGIVATQSCGTWGLTSTGAIDLARHVLYAISADGLLHALSLTSGTERPGWPVAITSAHADGEYVWGGLRLLRSTLYVPVASYCDVPGSDGAWANGRLVAVDVARARVAASFRKRLKAGPRFSFGLGDGLAAFVGQPSYSPPLRMIFESHVFDTRGGKKIGDGIQAFSINRHCGIARRWLTSVGQGQMPPPLVLGDVVFAAGGETGGYTALDGHTGKPLWRFATASATILPAIAAGSRIFAGDLGGVIRAFAR